MRCWIVLLFVSLCVCGCHRRYCEQDFVDSEWIACDGARVMLNEDGSSSVYDLNWRTVKGYIPDENNRHELERIDTIPSSFHGRWSLEDGADYRPWAISVYDDSGKHPCRFDIDNRNRLRIVIGDPDDANYYEFYRQGYFSQDSSKNRCASNNHIIRSHAHN